MSRNRNNIIFVDDNNLSETLLEYRGYVVQGVAITFIVLELIGYGLRMVARRINRVPFGWDDALMIPALLTNLGICITVLCKSSDSPNILNLD
jgi:hypothetical protein